MRFTEATAQAGICFQHTDGRSGARYFIETLGAGAAWFDYDRDGDVDLYFVNGAHLPGAPSGVTPTNALYRNNGDGTFTDVALFVGVALGPKGVPMGGMGTSFGDYDNDGWLDLVVTNFQDDPNSLYHNEGDGTFADASYASRLGGISLPYVGWGVDFVDLDNDGFTDLFIVNGHIYDNVEMFDPGYTYAQRNHLFRNRGDGTFDEISSECGPGLDSNKVSRGAAFGDYDNDGDVDILITNSNQTPDLLQNESVNQNRWLTLELIGMQSNRDAIGARVKLVTKGISRIREVKSGSSYLSQSDMRLHFGLGEASVVDRVEIRWPSGLVERFKGIEANQFLQVKEGEKRMARLKRE